MLCKEDPARVNGGLVSCNYYMKKMFNKIEEEGNNALKEIIEYKSFKCLSHA